ncbi:MAG: helix-turn-helix domain-containing protein [Micrococcales bacterium]|nr:helix-turn-helix domain-containing protein [Micrococcales bacterium]
MGDYSYRESGSPHVGMVWWAQVEQDAVYVDAANEFWGFAFGVPANGRPSATLIGPSLQPRELHLVAGERGWGVELAAHAFVRLLDKRRLLGEMRDLPTDGRWFELAGVRLPVPDVDALEGLVETLFRQGILAADEGVAAALSGQVLPQSQRSLHRHVVGATGLAPKKHEQLQRARSAYALLQDGWSLASAAAEAGFADQAHMTRAFTALAGRSPARILASGLSPFDSRP